MNTNLSLILPCFNEEKNISFIYEEFSQIPFNNNKAELILVNNGSTDNTDKEIDKIININEKLNNNITIRKVLIKENAGYGGGIKAGLKMANGDYIGWAHADLQSPLIDFFRLYELIKDKKQIFGKGRRINNRGFDGVISRLHEKIASTILGFEMREINAQPKIFSKDLMLLFKNIPTKWTTIDTYAVYLCLKNQIQIKEIDVIFKNRIYGESKWKNNFLIFIKHIFFNLLYLFKLRFFNEK